MKFFDPAFNRPIDLARELSSIDSDIGKMAVPAVRLFVRPPQRGRIAHVATGFPPEAA